MMLKRCLSLLLMALLILVNISNPVIALEAFEISAFDIVMDVQSDNSYEITETIDVEFLEQRHGIIRSIPLKTYRGAPAAITEIKVSGHKYKTSKDSGNLNIKIGDEKAYADKNEQYIISYTYAIGDDGLRDMDELYFNLIGTDWDCPISNITFTIKMPIRFDDEKLNFTYGKKGSTKNDAVSYTVEGRTITGKLNGSLGPNEALTVALPLQQGYFEDAKPINDGLVDRFGWLLSALAGIGGILIWLSMGKKKQSFPTVEFYPPQGTTSADVGFLIDGRVDPFDITSLIIYWADKGYLSIAEYNTKKLFGTKKSFLLTKLREMGDEVKPYERKMFSEMFLYGNGTQVYTEELSNRFYRTADEVKRFIENDFEGDPETRVFDKKNAICKLLLWVMMVLAVFPILVVCVDRVLNADSTGQLLIVSLIFSVLITASLYAIMYNITNWKSLPKKGRVNQVFIAFIFTLLSIGLSTYLAIESGILIYMIIAIAFATILSALSCRCKKRTSLGTWYEERLIGFRDFLKATELDRIKLLVNDNPQYFYNVLPFAMVLGVTDKWAKNFDSIMISPPQWYFTATPGRFSASGFAISLEQSLRSMSSDISSRPSSSSGGSSDGGSAGGGSGGGGGSSW
ncbi:MAG: DUF2207 domain-containing protein [Acetivibrionales bacterium]|jgi:uncharacterized membrane protein YgcG